MMNMQELETALRLNTPFVTLIFNDGGYGLIEWKQMLKASLGKITYTTFDPELLYWFNQAVTSSSWVKSSSLIPRASSCSIDSCEN
jgi:hypothetical protein